MPTVDVNGVSLYYEDFGSGRPIVFSHGIPTDHRAWSGQTGPFSKVHRVITYSRRYAYPNKREGDVTDSTVGNNAEDLRGLIEKLDAGPVDLIGHSYGGFIAAQLAADHPELVRSLVLVEPAISTLLVTDERSQAQMLSLLIRSPSVALSAREFQLKSLYPSLRALDGGETEMAVTLNVDGVQGASGSFAAMPEPQRKMMLDNARTIAELRTKFPPFKSQIHKITCNTLVVNGEESALWLRRIGKIAATSLPHAWFAMISKSRHFPHIEKAQEFNERVLNFLSTST
ncbi:MAG: alpha/beta hydrolase [Thaumarchaeota archaeon]|nr:alpha/beta hydrolase [Nitrososphaerota archaeon]